MRHGSAVSAIDSNWNWIRWIFLFGLKKRQLNYKCWPGVATWAAIQHGYLKPSPRFGNGPKILAACLFGYFVGKLSYQQACAEKIMRIPNSKLAEALRRRKKGEFFENFTPDGGLSLAPFSSSTDVYTDENLKAHQTNPLDLDVDRPSSAGLDDTYRPSLDTPDRNFNDNLPLEPPKSSVSYEELRRRNREEHDRRMQQPFSRWDSPIIFNNDKMLITTFFCRAMPREEAPVVRRTPDEGFSQGGAKNKYGDEWK